MANAKHVEILVQGTARWNAWRDDAAEERPDLRDARLSGLDLTGANLSHADLAGGQLKDVKLRGANLTGADFSGAQLSFVDLTGATLTRSRWSGVRVSDIRYARRQLAGKCAGLGGASEISGDAMFRSDVSDQDYLDSLQAELRRNYPFAWNDNGYAFMRALWARASAKGEPSGRRAAAGIVCAALGSLNWVTARAGAVFGYALALLLDADALAPFQTGAGSSGFVPAFGFSLWEAAWWIMGGVLFSALVAGWYGRAFFVWLWTSMFDNGRDWYSVVAFGAVCVFGFGCAYALVGPDVILLPKSNGHPLYPWFVALMGFCTLGISDAAVPKGGLGMLIMALNVLSGFLTLGLLISIVGGAFAKRA